MINNMNKIILTLLAIISIVCFPSHIFAVTVNPGTGNGANANTSSKPSSPPSNPISKLDNPIHANNITDLLYQVIDLAINIGAIVAVIMFIVIGFKFVMAQGNETALKTTKEWFLYAVIGTAVLISSKVIVEVVKSTLIEAGVVKQDLFNRR